MRKRVVGKKKTGKSYKTSRIVSRTSLCGCSKDHMCHVHYSLDLIGREPIDSCVSYMESKPL